MDLISLHKVYILNISQPVFHKAIWSPLLLDCLSVFFIPVEL